MPGFRSALLLSIIFIAVSISPCLAGYEVKIHVNNPSDTVFADAMNTVEIWIENDLPLAAMTLPFAFSTNSGTLSWVSPYGSLPTANPVVKVDADIDPMTWGSLNGWQCSMPANQLLIGGVTGNPAYYLPAHATSTRILSLKLDGSTLVGNGGFLWVDAVFIPPAGTLSFTTGTGSEFMPQFYLCPNCDPDLPEVWIPVVQRTWVKGDASGDGVLDVSDAVFLIRYIFDGGTAPAHVQAGDVNCDDQISVSDVVKVIRYIFGGGPGPC